MSKDMGRFRPLCRTRPQKKKDHIHAVFKAKGHILINGLGIGMVLNACLLKPEVAHATVIEISQDVINLVADHYNRKFPGKVEIIHADAFEYTPPKNKKFDMVWHDIWPDICPDNLPEMTQLHRKYAKRTTWQNSWAKEICQQTKKQWNKIKY